MRVSKSHDKLKLILLLVLVSVLASCKVAKEAGREATIYRKPEKVIGLTQDSDIAFQRIALRANVTVSNGKSKTSFKASIRMHRDSVIWSSMTMLGIAGAKTLITADSIKIVNYREKNYISEPYELLQEYLHSDLLSLPNFQNLLLGDWLYIGEFDKYRLKYNDTNYVLTTMSERRLEKDWMEKKIDRLEKKIDRQEERDAEKAQEKKEKKLEKKPRKYEGLALEIEIDPFELKVVRMLVKDYYFDGVLTTSYSDFKEVGDFNIPHNVHMTVDGRNRMDVEIEYYKISLDPELSTPFSIPRKYERARL